MGSSGKTSTGKHSLLGTSEGRLWSAPYSGPARAAAAVARREPDGMTSSVAPVWNAAGEGAGCPVPVRPRSPFHPPASRYRAGAAEGPWDPFPSAARAGMRIDGPGLALCPPLV